MNSIKKVWSQIALLKSLQYLPGANELNQVHVRILSLGRVRACIVSLLCCTHWRAILDRCIKAPDNINECLYLFFVSERKFNVMEHYI